MRYSYTVQCVLYITLPYSVYILLSRSSVDSGILSYRILRFVRKPYLKLVHASMLGGTAVLWAFGLVAAFDSHNLATPPIPNLYTLHSWLGLATVSLFALQVGVENFTFVRYNIVDLFNGMKHVERGV